jgi:DNA-binding CsgD family transcriptional regulator
VARAIRALSAGAETSVPFESLSENKRLEIRPAGRTSQGSVVFTLTETGDALAVSLESKYGLTSREAEVLGWVAAGKTSRDIADILGMSARTVDKHLEHVFVKLGVETRAAAAAIAAKFGAAAAERADLSSRR